MKWYYWAAIAVGAYLLFFRKKGAVLNTLANADPTAGKTLTTIMSNQGPGMAGYDTNPKNYVLVDPSSPEYPGYGTWYKSTVDDSWYNLDDGYINSQGVFQGEFYGGASPAHYKTNAELQAEAQAAGLVPYIDVNAVKAPLPGDDMPIEETYGAGGGVIY
jgi:hypothetical protein